METCYRDQLDRVDRLMKIIEADDPYKHFSGLLFYDTLIFACQSMWHLKDWVLNDPGFGAKDHDALSRDIHSARCLLVCSDLANGSKHFALTRPKVGGGLERSGLHIDRAKGIHLEFYYIICPDPSDEFHHIEVRTLLRHCRDTWDSIIDRHYLTEVVGSW